MRGWSSNTSSQSFLSCVEAMKVHLDPIKTTLPAQGSAWFSVLINSSQKKVFKIMCLEIMKIQVHLDPKSIQKIKDLIWLIVPIPRYFHAVEKALLQIKETKKVHAWK